jgi:hypothetical protein
MELGGRSDDIERSDGKHNIKECLKIKTVVESCYRASGNDDLGGCENDLVGMTNYGIVPLPKFDENQQINRSAIHDSFSAFSIPNFNFNDDELAMIGAVLEVMASQSFKTITPAYYEQALKGRYANDPQSVRMLDEITQNVWIEAGILNCNAIEAPHKTFRDAIKNHYPNVTSLFTQKAKITARKVSELNEKLEKLLG